MCRQILKFLLYTCRLVCVEHLQRDPQNPQLFLGRVAMWSETETGGNASKIVFASPVGANRYSEMKGN